MELDSSRWRSEPLRTRFDTQTECDVVKDVSTHHPDDTSNICMAEEKKKRLATVS